MFVYLPSMARTWWVGVVLWAWFSSTAWAQGTPPDVVRMHDGSFVRGTIVESTPEHVVIQLATGEVRTIERSVVAAVRAADAAAPSTGAPPSTSSRQTQQRGVRVSSAEEGLSLHRVTGSRPVMMSGANGAMFTALVDSFTLVCVAPCIADLPAGGYRLGVARGSGQPVRAEEVIHLGPRDLHLELDYVDRSGIRGAGWATWIGGVLAGGALALAAVFAGPEECRASGRCSPTLDLPMLIAGGVIVCLSPIVGVPLAFWGDTAIVRRPR